MADSPMCRGVRRVELRGQRHGLSNVEGLLRGLQLTLSQRVRCLADLEAVQLFVHLVKRGGGADKDTQ
jgi:hypothetical protein